jgi:DNA repair protein RadC
MEAVGAAAVGEDRPMQAWSRLERPRERLLESGPANLSDAELLAVLLGAGLHGRDALAVARELLEARGGLIAALQASPNTLASHHGIGPARVARLLAALEIGRRYLEAPSQGRTCLRAPEHAVRVFRARLSDLPHEVFSCLFLDTRHRLIRYEELFRGTVDGAAVYPREILKRALHHNASAVIVGHNHPSGVCEPSEADRAITLKLGKVLALVEIRLLDHLVVSRDGHVSLAEKGWI